ncbi:GNAT family N-acetyltransferase [Ectothiorhodospira sp. BSL-9]|uniref:GNAT family N-acetyltransferase n=1 Tax=Ectothiorhodospira sp. BSL-9 TaxID=1442136 RepID=UPI0007B45198|nr:GNAT family N-acetyltransferase [Ectothiorhodospira sp. BSL-9]ANB02219.1 hypothetical protein ECTOBSL9_1558 [Ectothiorhodospira sp. BSL-9]
MNSYTEEFAPFVFYLNFRLGEIGLAERKIPVLRKIHSMDEIAAGRSVPVPSVLPDECAGVYLARLPQVARDAALSDTSGLTTYEAKQYQHCYIDLSGTFDDYLARFSSKTRSTLKRKIKKFSEFTLGLDFRVFHEVQDMAVFHADARTVSALTYQERLLDAGMPDGPVFVERLHQHAANNSVRGFLLYDRGRPVSYLYCPVKGASVEYAYLGYDPAYGKYSPGTVLLWLALEHLFAEKRYRFFDFTEGGGEHKLLFSTHQVACSNILLLRPTAGNRISLQTHRALNTCSDTAGSILDKIGLKHGLKKFIRRKAA